MFANFSCHKFEFHAHVKKVLLVLLVVIGGFSQYAHANILSLDFERAYHEEPELAIRGQSDTVFLPRQTLCYEDREGIIFGECDTIMDLDPGVHLICCDVMEMGAAFTRCREYVVREKPEQGYQLVVLCEEEPVPHPTIPDCGQYVDTIFGGAASGCDSTVHYDIAFMRADVKIILPTRRTGNKVMAEVSPACDRITPEYTGTWIDPQSGTVLAHDTYSYDVTGPWQYCFLLQAEFQGQLCPPQSHCFTIKGPLTGPPELTFDSLGGSIFNPGLTVPGTVDADRPFAGKLEMFPNPASGVVTVSMDQSSPLSSDATVRIMDLTGNVLYEKRVSSDAFFGGVPVDTGALPCGVYFISLEQEGSVSLGRLVIDR